MVIQFFKVLSGPDKPFQELRAEQKQQPKVVLRNLMVRLGIVNRYRITDGDQERLPCNVKHDGTVCSVSYSMHEGMIHAIVS